MLQDLFEGNCFQIKPPCSLDPFLHPLISEHLIAPVTAVSWKVILYNLDQVSNSNSRTVVNFQRENCLYHLQTSLCLSFPKLITWYSLEEKTLILVGQSTENSGKIKNCESALL